MRTPNRIALGLAMIAVAPLAKAQATDQSEEMWRRFYAKLGSMVHTLDPNNQGLPASNTRFLMCSPGRFLRKYDSKNSADRAEVFQMLDEVPEFGANYTPIMGTRFSDIYEEILLYKNADKDEPLNEEEKNRLAEALKATKSTTDLMKKYYKFEDKYLKEAQAREVKYFESLASGTHVDRMNLTAMLNRVEAQWYGEGNRNIVRNYLDTIMTLSRRGTQIWWSDRLEYFKSTRFGNVSEVTTFPSMDSWNSNDGWTKFSFKRSVKQSKETLNERDVEASATLKFLKWGGSGSGGSNTKALNSLNTDESLTISMDFKKVFISRPWMDWGVFTSDRWDWRGRKVVSDGLGGGRMPLYINAFIIVRNVKLTATSIRNFRAELMKEIRGRGRAGWGPFSTSTSVREKTEEKITEDLEDRSSLTIKDPQIIGYTCTQVPACPAKQFMRK